MLRKILYRGPALADLHASYAKAGRIDSRAPLRSAQDVTIWAPSQVVWERLTDVGHWADNLEPRARGIRLDPNGVAVDAVFVRRAGGVRLTARFAVVDPTRELSWTGSALGIKVVHRFTLEPIAGDSTRVHVEESMAGPMLLFFTQHALERVVAESLRTLKKAAEQPAAVRP